MNQQEIEAFFQEHTFESEHFARFNGISVTEISREKGVGTLAVTPHAYNLGQTVHGGALFTLADTVAGTFVLVNGGDCVTSNGTMEFLRPARGAQITCTATPKKMGHALCIIGVVLTDEMEKVVATGTYTFYLTGDEGGNLTAR